MNQTESVYVVRNTLDDEVIVVTPSKEVRDIVVTFHLKKLGYNDHLIKANLNGDNAGDPIIWERAPYKLNL